MSSKRSVVLIFSLVAAGLGAAFLLTREGKNDKTAKPSSKSTPPARPQAPRPAAPRAVTPVFKPAANDNRQNTPVPQKDAPDIKITINSIRADGPEMNSIYPALGKPLITAISEAMQKGEVESVYIEGVSNKGQKYKIMFDPRDPKDANLLSMIVATKTYHITDYGTGYEVKQINEGPYTPTQNATHVLKR